MASIDRQVGGSADDCRVYWDGSAWVLDLTFTNQVAGYASSVANKQGGGMRFTNITIPQGATITAAYLTLTCRLADSGTTVNSVIIGEDVDDAATFSDLANYQSRRGTIVGGANDDYLTSASVNWNSIGAWVAETEYQSPDITAIIQEIINRGGWASGNALVLFWDDHAGNSSAYAKRRAYSYDGSSAKAPKLHIEYEAGTEKSSSDAGSGVEDTPVPSATLAGSEAGSGIEALFARLLAALDTGIGTEAGGLQYNKDLLATETAEGSDRLTAKIEIPTKGGGMKLWT